METFDAIARAIETAAQAILGLDLESHDLSALQMAVRALVVYVSTVAMVRLGKRRFLSRATAFDVVLGIILGSVVSRGITGNAPLGPALAAAASLIVMHWLFSALSARWHRFGVLINGNPRVMIDKGEIRWDQLRAAHMSEHDLWEDLRSKGVARLDEVAEARLERSGELSVIKS